MVYYWVQILKMLFQNVDITCQFTENIDGFIYHILSLFFFVKHRTPLEEALR